MCLVPLAQGRLAEQGIEATEEEIRKALVINA